MTCRDCECRIEPGEQMQYGFWPADKPVCVECAESFVRSLWRFLAAADRLRGQAMANSDKLEGHCSH